MAQSQALTVAKIPFDALVQQAEVIVVATVTGRHGTLGADGYTIYTRVTLADIEVIKGDVPAAVFDLRLPGGVVGDHAQVYAGIPRLELGQRYVLFIKGQQREFIPLFGAYQGVYQVVHDAAGNTHVVRSDHLANPVVQALTVSTAPDLDTFLAQIREHLAAAVSAPPP